MDNSDDSGRIATPLIKKCQFCRANEGTVEARSPDGYVLLLCQDCDMELAWSYAGRLM